MRVVAATRSLRYLQMAAQSCSRISTRPEAGHDISQIQDIITQAFATKSHLNHKEGDIVDSLRKAGALSLSMVAILNQPKSNTIVGHIAASPVLIGNKNQGWYGLGPVSVRPSHQGQGIGSALIKDALKVLQDAGAAGCVVAGSPKYYQRFGFEHDTAMTFEGAPVKYFQRIVVNGPAASGRVTYHDAFNIT